MLRDGVSLVHTIGIEIAFQNTQLFWLSNLSIMILDISENCGIHKRKIPNAH